MQPLSIPKLKIPNKETNCKTEKKSSCSASIVGVEVVRHVHGLVSVVHNAEESPEGAVGKGRRTS